MTDTTKTFDPFQARDTFETGTGRAGIYRLTKLENPGWARSPAALFDPRAAGIGAAKCDGYEVTEEDVREPGRLASRGRGRGRDPLQAGPGRAAGFHRRAGRGRSGGHADAPCSGWAAIRSGSIR